VGYYALYYLGNELKTYQFLAIMAMLFTIDADVSTGIISFISAAVAIVLAVAGVIHYNRETDKS
jgi:hypothetical protein